MTDKSSDEDEDDADDTKSADASNDGDDSDDDEEDEGDELSADDDQIAAALQFTKDLLVNADDWVKNYDPTDGITLQQANTAVFTKLKGKGVMKGVVGSLVSNPKFHEKYAAEGGWKFDAEEGVIHPKKKSKK